MKLEKIEIKSRSDEWNKFVANNLSSDIVNSSIAHNPSLAQIFEDSFGYQCEYYFLIENNEIIGLLPGFRIKNRFTSIPMFPSAGIFTGQKEKKISFYESITSILRKYEIRDTIKFSKYCNETKILCYVPLENNTDLQWNKLTSDKRNHIRKGYKYGLTIKLGGAELLDDFYNIYSYNMHHLGSPVIEKKFFQNLLENYKYGIAKVFICYHGNIPVGGSIALSYFNLLEVSWASTLINYNKFKPNMVLYWEMIKFSIENGLSYFSFGRSTKNSGAHEFKLRWGALEQQLFFNYSNYTFDIRNLKPLTILWRKLPLNIANKIGPALRKFTRI
jgi:hypothetical protein